MGNEPKYGFIWGGINPLTGQPYRWGDKVYWSMPVAPSPNPEVTVLFHVSLAFATMKDNDLDDKATHVASMMTANAAIFASPPFPVANLTTAQGNFHAAIAAAADLGKSLTADKKNKRAILIGLLRQYCHYIESIPNISPTNAALSGFDIIEAGHHPAVSLMVPVILGITNEGPGKLRSKLQGVKGASGYEYQVTVGTGKPAYAGRFSSTRDNVLTGLTSGTTYAVQVRAQGGNNQFSDWSLPITIMCT